MQTQEFQVQFRDLDESLLFPLMRLAETGQTRLTVYLDEVPTISGRHGRGSIGAATLRSGFFPLTLDQVAEFCHNDVVEIVELGEGTADFVRLVEARHVTLLDLYASQIAVESVQRMVVIPTSAKPSVGTLTSDKLNHLAEAEGELLQWAKQAIDFWAVPRPTRAKTVPKIAEKASALGFKDSQGRAKWVWTRLNPHKKPGAPRGPRDLRPPRK